LRPWVQSPVLEKNNSKWIKELNVRLETTRKNIEKTLQDTGIGSNFLGRTPMLRK
jgi:hypothetical protein